MRLRAQGVVCASPIRFSFKPPRVRNAGEMTIGHNLILRCPLTKAQLETAKSGRLLIGNHVFINEGVIIYSEAAVTIGDYAKLGDFTAIHDSNFHELSPTDRPLPAPVVIGRNAWLARNVLVMPGVTIGENAVIAAGAIVTADVAPNTVVAGNPARLIRRLAIEDPEHYIRS